MKIRLLFCEALLLLYFVKKDFYVKKLIIVMGISGSGKSTLGKQLAEKLGIPFLDADGFHPRENVMKMSRGTPLEDDDRWPWLAAIGNYVIDSHRDIFVLACSALKQSYRDYLDQRTNNTYVYLSITKEAAIERMNNREAHFMKSQMVKSQLETLEEPLDAIKVSHTLSVKGQITTVIKHLGDNS